MFTEQAPTVLEFQNMLKLTFQLPDAKKKKKKKKKKKNQIYKQQNKKEIYPEFKHFQ